MLRHLQEKYWRDSRGSLSLPFRVFVQKRHYIQKKPKSDFITRYGRRESRYCGFPDSPRDFFL
jgi:hypothetical protein